MRGEGLARYDARQFTRTGEAGSEAQTLSGILEPRLPGIGDQVAGRYRIVSKLGSGGFGVVFHARQESMGRDVAIKFLSPEVSNDPVAVERFRREAFYSSGLRHPNTIVIHDYGQTDDKLFYIVMELLEGQPLSKAIFVGGGLSLGRALHIGEQILRSLGEAHQRGLVHRDLKPENIFLVDLLGEEDFVKVLDFGLSKALSPDNPALTQEGVVFGTPLYLAPEQAYGEEVLPASDLFAFGLLLYEMLRGERPFRGRTSMEVLLKLTQEALPRLPAPLEGSPVQVFVDRLTQKEPGDRYPSAVEALPELQKLLRGDSLRDMGDLGSVYVGLKARPAALKAPPPPPLSPLSPVEPSAATPRPARPSTLEPASSLSPMSTSGRVKANVIGAQDILGDLFAPEELEASVRQVVRAESIASGKMPSLDVDAPGAVSINLDVARTPSSTRRRYRDRGARTLITTIDAVSDSRPGEEKTLSEVSFDAPLIGRQEELLALDQRGVQALKGVGGMVLFEGEAGVGKTRLVEEFKKMMIRRGAAVFEGAYRENSIGPGTGLRQAVEQLLRINALSDEKAQQVVERRLGKLEIDAPEFVPMLMRALRPGLVQGEPTSVMSRTSAPVAFRVLERLLIREAQIRPVVLLVEDLHWADPFTLGFTEYLVSDLGDGSEAPVERLVRSDKPLPFLCVCTLRRSHMTQQASVVGAVQSMGRSLGKSFMRLEVNPLDHKGASQLIQHVLPLEVGLRQRLIRHAKGNPLYLLQFLRLVAHGNGVSYSEGGWELRSGALSEGMPGSLQELLQRRLEQAERQDPERDLLGDVARLSSVLGSRFSHKLLESFFVNLGRPELVRKLTGVLDALVQVGLIERVAVSPGEVDYQFVHAMVQETLSSWLKQDPSVSSYHEAAARAKEVSVANDPTTSMSLHADVAQHWEAAGEAERAIEFRLRSARAAERSLDLETARLLYRKVEEELGRDGIASSVRVNVQLRLGALHIRLGALGPAEDILKRGADAARALSDARAEGRAQILIGKVYTLQSRHREALRCFRRATACLTELERPDAEDEVGLAEAQLGQAEVARLRGELGTAEGVLAEALHKARRVDAVEVEAQCLHNLGRIAHLCGRLKDALGLLKDAGERFEQCGQVIARASVNADRGLSQLYTQGRVPAEASIRQALDVLEAAGDQLLSAHTRVYLGIALRRGADLEAAAKVTNQALSVFNRLQNIYGIAKATLLLGEIVFLRGDVALAQNLGKQALGLHEKIGDAHGTAMSLMFLGSWALDGGEIDQAEAQLTHAMNMFEKGGILLYRPQCQLQLGRVAQSRGQIERSRALITESWQEARASGNREMECNAALMLGTGALIEGHLGKARGFIQTGLNVARDLRLEHTQVLLLFGLALIETLSNNVEERQKAVDAIVAFRRRASDHELFLRERVAAIARSVSVVRGLTEADHYRRAALAVLQLI